MVVVAVGMGAVVSGKCLRRVARERWRWLVVVGWRWRSACGGEEGAAVVVLAVPVQVLLSPAVAVVVVLVDVLRCFWFEGALAGVVKGWR